LLQIYGMARGYTERTNNAPSLCKIILPNAPSSLFYRQKAHSCSGAEAGAPSIVSYGTTKRGGRSLPITHPILDAKPPVTMLLTISRFRTLSPLSSDVVS
jgi:hypothetical protein